MSEGRRKLIKLKLFIYTNFVIFCRSRSRHAAPLPPPPMHNMMHMSSEECTTVVFSFCDEQFPYRTKIPGKQPTLKQFKDYLPKKGSFR